MSQLIPPAGFGADLLNQANSVLEACKRRGMQVKDSQPTAMLLVRNSMVRDAGEVICPC